MQNAWRPHHPAMGTSSQAIQVLIVMLHCWQQPLLCSDDDRQKFFPLNLGDCGMMGILLLVWICSKAKVFEGLNIEGSTMKRSLWPGHPMAESSGQVRKLSKTYLHHLYGVPYYTSPISTHDSAISGFSCCKSRTDHCTSDGTPYCAQQSVCMMWSAMSANHAACSTILRHACNKAHGMCWLGPSQTSNGCCIVIMQMLKHCLSVQPTARNLLTVLQSKPLSVCLGWPKAARKVYLC